MCKIKNICFIYYDFVDTRNIYDFVVDVYNGNMKI